MLGAGPLTQLRVLRFAPAHSTETRRKPPATADGLGGCCASVSFRRVGYCINDCGECRTFAAMPPAGAARAAQSSLRRKSVNALAAL